MKKIAVIFLIIVLVFCNACTGTDDGNAPPKGTQQTTVLPSSSAEPTTFPPATPNSTERNTPEPTSPALVLPEPIQAKPGTYIPDIIKDNAEKSSSNEWFYEDEQYLCLGDSSRGQSNLYIVNKKNKKTEVITNNYGLFSAGNGFVYYTTKDYNEIIRYDIKTKTKQTIVSTDDKIWSMACLGDKLYFSCELFQLDTEPILLFVCDINGDNLTEIGENADSFCIYNGRIFGVTSGELGDLVEYYYEGPRAVIINRPIYFDFDISLGRVVLSEHHNSERNYSNNLTYDINSGELYELAPISPYYTLVGQYMVYIEADESNGAVLLMAYDFLDNIEYTLYDISSLLDDSTKGTGVQFYRENLYLRIREHEKLSLFKVSIQSGKAEIEPYISIGINEKE